MQRQRFKLQLREPRHLSLESHLPRLTGKRSRDHAKEEKNANALQRLREYAVRPMPSEIRVLSEELLQITLHAERLHESLISFESTAQATDVARVAWENEARLRLYSLSNRYLLSNEHRVALFIARLRCIALGSGRCLELMREYLRSSASAPNAETFSSSSSSSTTHKTGNVLQGKATASLRQARVDALVQRYEDGERDRELFAAHAIFWPCDTKSQFLYNWCATHELMPPNLNDVDDSVAQCTLNTLWMCIRTLLCAWNELPYCAQLIAYYYRLLERAADLSMYSGDSLTFNHPQFFKQIDLGERCINEKYLTEFERSCFAIESRLHRCTYAKWPGPKVLRQRTYRREFSPSALLGADALKRFNDFIWKQLGLGMFVQSVQRDFRVCVFDDLVLPGEMERFEKRHPNEDRKPMSCIAKMRRSDFDRYQKLFNDPEVTDVWKYLIEKEKYTHPAYALIASRVLQVYFDARLDGAQFDSYYLTIDRLPVEHLRESVSSALRDYGADMRACLTRGTARHALGGTFVRSGLAHTRDSHYAHPLIVRFIGVPAVLKGEEGAIIEQVGAPGRNTFATAFLTWLREFCGDERIAGTLSNGASLVPLLKELQPTHDSDRVALRALKIREKLHAERSNLTGLEFEVKRIGRAVPQQSTDTKIVL